MPALGLAEIRPTLLINDYQNARVDAAQFQNLTEEVKALSGDCVCCGSRDELFSFLQEFKHSPGRVMIVETNGTNFGSAAGCFEIFELFICCVVVFQRSSAGMPPMRLDRGALPITAFLPVVITSGPSSSSATNIAATSLVGSTTILGDFSCNRGLVIATTGTELLLRTLGLLLPAPKGAIAACSCIIGTGRLLKEGCLFLASGSPSYMNFNMVLR